MDDEADKPQAGNLPQAWAEFTRRGQRIVEAFWERQMSGADHYEVVDPSDAAKAFFELAGKMMTQPAALAEAQASLWNDYVNLWTSTARRMMGESVEPVARPAPDDRRFKDEAWTEEVFYDFVKQSYLVTARWIQSTVRGVDDLDPETARKVDFFTRQFIDAVAPTNFAATNPQVLRAAIETNGQSLIEGLENLLSDLEKGKGRLAISMTRDDAFDLGRNVATTPGKVVFRNDLMELLQYQSSTETVARRPLLIVPPWINKFYVLDLQPRNSFIKWAVDQGHTVFVISWVNPGAELGHKQFEDYMLEGPLAALEAIERATGEAEVNLVGYCIGGTLSACTLAHLAAKGDGRIRSATLLTTMLDFAEAGELAVFVDEDQLERLERHMEEKGYLEGRHMATVFNLMRDNDLIWSFVVNNYLLGKAPLPFDLLYWNADSTRMPAMMHRFYLRNMYLENRLVEPGALTLAGTPIDLHAVETPTYVLSTREDHIAPWTSTFAATRLFSGPVRFVLSASGHIAGVVNPPEAGKYCHWTHSRKLKSPEAWLDKATRHDGSWWPDWMKWLNRHGGGKVPARIPGQGKLKVVGEAPGEYVRVRVGD